MLLKNYRKMYQPVTTLFILSPFFSIPSLLSRQPLPWFVFSQTTDGIPVHLKGGVPDRLLYRTTMALTVGGALYCLVALYIAAQPRNKWPTQTQDPFCNASDMLLLWYIDPTTFTFSACPRNTTSIYHCQNITTMISKIMCFLCKKKKKKKKDV